MPVEIKSLKTHYCVFLLALLFAFCFSLFSCNSNVSTKKYNDDVVILFTNDVYCALTSTEKSISIKSSTGDTTTRTFKTLGLAKIKGFKSYNQESGSRVLLVDSGNYTWGDGGGSLVSQLSQGEDIITFMINAGYDYLGIGNREFQFGVDKLSRYLKISKGKIKYLCCNLDKENIIPRPNQLDSDNFITNFSIEKFGKTQVAFIGITSKETENSGPMGGYKVLDFDETCSRINSVAKRALEVMRSAKDGNGKYYVVLLSHLGNDESTGYDINALVSRLQNVNVVLDGYSLEPNEHVSDNTLIDADGIPVYYGHASRYGEKVGKVTITGTDSGSKISVDYYTSSDIVFQETTLEKKISQITTDIDKNLRSTIGFTKRDISRFGRPLDYVPSDPNKQVEQYLFDYKNSLNTESFVGDLVTDSYRKIGGEYAKADGKTIRAAVAIPSSFSSNAILVSNRDSDDDNLRTPTPVTLAECFNFLDRYGYIGYTEFNGVQLKEFFEHAISHRTVSDLVTPVDSTGAYNIYKSYTESQDGTVITMCTDDKDFNGFLQVSGLKIKCYIDPNNPKNNRVSSIMVLKEDAASDSTTTVTNWESIDLEDETKYYTVAGTAYVLLQGGDGYKDLDGFEETSNKFKYLYAGKELLTEAHCFAEYIGTLPERIILKRSVSTGRIVFTDDNDIL